MGEMDMTTQDDTSKTLDYNAHIDRESVLAYFTGRGMSIELARRLVDDAAPMATPGNPTKDTMHTFPEPDINETASFLAVKISTDPDRFTPGMRALAKAYESQRERIADLEEDVERLRPKEAFVPEVLFQHSSSSASMIVETKEHGELFMSISSAVEGIPITITPEKGIELTTALSKWAGLDGVEWREIKGEGKPDDIKDLVDVLLTDGTRTGIGCWCPDWNGWNWPRGNLTHWAPLPKPPVVK